MSDDAARYLTHDCDEARVELLVDVGQGGNGDFYISIVSEGDRSARLAPAPGEILGAPATVRIVTSGERRQHAGVARAVRILHRAIQGHPPPSAFEESAVERVLALPNFYRLEQHRRSGGGGSALWAAAVHVPPAGSMVWGQGESAEEAAEDLLRRLPPEAPR